MGTFSTSQENFWAGEFGNDYINRNNSSDIVASNTALFSKIMARTVGVSSVLELGANIGLNLIALHSLMPNIELTGLEINAEAFSQLNSLPFVHAIHNSIYDIDTNDTYDLVFTKTVLIHISPDRLKDVYKILYSKSSNYILVCEYYNPSPVEVNYRGNTNVLFKRDFPGEMMDLYPDLILVDYGFVYHRDNVFPADDFTWFLMKKTK